MKYLSRNKVYQKLEPFKNAKKIYIFCEGEKTEIDYFKFFQGFASNIDIIPIPNDRGKSDPTKLKDKAEQCINDNVITISEELLDEVWFVVDTDRWNEGDKINQLKAFINGKNLSYKGWSVAQSNPSFELWLYYHFFSEKPDHSNVTAYTSFKEFVGSKIKGGFDSRSMPLEIQQAVCNSMRNFELLNGQPSLYSTDVFKLAEQIIKFTKSQLDHCLADIKRNLSS